MDQARYGADVVTRTLRKQSDKKPWIPALHQIEKWWEPAVLDQLAKARSAIEGQSEVIGSRAATLLKLAFCRTMIDLAKVSFSHQSMSFKKPAPTLLMDFGPDVGESVGAKWEQATRSIFAAAHTEISAKPQFAHCDARSLDSKLARDSFDCVVTSPPYPNRMSYIRELRPYMYWLG